MFSDTPQSTLTTSATEYRYASASQLDGECARLGLDRWLCDTEIRQLKQWRNPHRRQDWLRGRMLAKQLITNNLDMPHEWKDIAIVREGQSQRPCVLIRGERKFWSLSISHSLRGVLVALSRQSDTSVGADLTDRTPLSPHFTKLWFTSAEIARLHEEADPFAANIHWALKEALFKACNRGEGFDPRRIEVLGSCANYYGTPVTFEAHHETIDDQIAVVVTVCNFHQPLTNTN